MTVGNFAMHGLPQTTCRADGHAAVFDAVDALVIQIVRLAIGQAQKQFADRKPLGKAGRGVGMATSRG
jgi:hypothetical protein